MRLWGRYGLAYFSHFMLSAQASGAQVKSFSLTVYTESDRVNIRQPTPPSVAFRVAYIITELGYFTT